MGRHPQKLLFLGRARNMYEAHMITVRIKVIYDEAHYNVKCSINVFTLFILKNTSVQLCMIEARAMLLVIPVLAFSYQLNYSIAQERNMSS